MRDPGDASLCSLNRSLEIPAQITCALASMFGACELALRSNTQNSGVSSLHEFCFNTGALGWAC